MLHTMVQKSSKVTHSRVSCNSWHRGAGPSLGMCFQQLLCKQMNCRTALNSTGILGKLEWSKYGFPSIPICKVQNYPGMAAADWCQSSRKMYKVTKEKQSLPVWFHQPTPSEQLEVTPLNSSRTISAPALLPAVGSGSAGVASCPSWG